MSKKILVGALSVLTAATAFGCASTPTTPQSTTSTQVTAERSVMALPEQSAQEVAQLVKQLPARISVADADKMLTTIDPSTIKTDATRHVNIIGFRGYGGIHGGWGHLGYGGLGFNRFRYFGFHHRYFPYYYYNNFYYPYYSYGYYPYLYSYANTCYPYSYWY